MVKLKPCPFCGEVPNILECKDRWCILHDCGVVRINTGLYSKEATSEYWNTRLCCRKLEKLVDDISDIVSNWESKLSCHTYQTLTKISEIIADYQKERGGE